MLAMVLAYVELDTWLGYQSLACRAVKGGKQKCFETGNGFMPVSEDFCAPLTKPDQEVFTLTLANEKLFVGTPPGEGISVKQPAYTVSGKSRFFKLKIRKNVIKKL